MLKCRSRTSNVDVCMTSKTVPFKVKEKNSYLKNCFLVWWGQNIYKLSKLVGGQETSIFFSSHKLNAFKIIILQTGGSGDFFHVPCDIKYILWLHNFSGLLLKSVCSQDYWAAQHSGSSFFKCLWKSPVTSAKYDPFQILSFILKIQPWLLWILISYHSLGLEQLPLFF